VKADAGWLCELGAASGEVSFVCLSVMRSWFDVCDFSFFSFFFMTRLLAGARVNEWVMGKWEMVWVCDHW